MGVNKRSLNVEVLEHFCMLQSYHAVWCSQTLPQGTVHIDYLLSYSLKRTQISQNTEVEMQY